jgi:cardiolipin synthase
MFKAIGAARHHIHVQSYIIGRDAVGRALLDRLADRARAGVQVRVLFDQYGSRAAYLTGLFRRYNRVPNMRCAGFTQANPIKRQFQLNLRNHRKNLIIDGRIGFLGGVNFHDVYIPGRRREAIHDYHFRVRGPAVLELQYTFLRDWFYMCDEDARALLVPGHFPQPEAAGDTPLRLLNASPNASEQPLVDALFTLLGAARQQVLVITPYLVLSEDLRRAFRAAALRGVDVKILLPAINNHPSVDWAARASYDELLLSGVRLFLRRPPFIHAKAMLVDDRIALIGSANLDARSLRLSHETNLVAFDPEFAARLKQTLLDDFALADEITLAAWRARPRYAHYLENFFNLMSPTL